MRIALDAMGGDYAPKNTIEGAASALKAQPEIEKLILVGNTPAIESELRRIGFQDPRIEIFHASEEIDMHESAARAIRQKKDASVSRCLNLVKIQTLEARVPAAHTRSFF